MIFNVEWLKEHLNTTKSGEEICKKLNEIGLEVEEDLQSEKIFDKIVTIETEIRKALEGMDPNSPNSKALDTRLERVMRRKEILTRKAQLYEFLNNSGVRDMSPDEIFSFIPGGGRVR